MIRTPSDDESKQYCAERLSRFSILFSLISPGAAVAATAIHFIETKSIWQWGFLMMTTSCGQCLVSSGIVTNQRMLRPTCSITFMAIIAVIAESS